MVQHSVDEPRTVRNGTPQDGMVLSATRELLWIETADDARTAALRLVDELGGSVVVPDTAGADALPIDLSFGIGEPVVPSAPVDSVARLLLSRHLPGFVRDAHRAVELAARTERLTQDAEIDMLTGLPNRRVMGRALSRLRSDDTVIMLDLDHFKQLNDQLGHLQGDEVLRSLGRSITETVRARDLASRFGGEEFLILLNEPIDAAGVETFLERLRANWEECRPHPVTFSAGIARVGGDSGDVVERADAAMYAIKAHAWKDRRAKSDALDLARLLYAADVTGLRPDNFAASVALRDASEIVRDAFRLASGAGTAAAYRDPTDRAKLASLCLRVFG